MAARRRVYEARPGLVTGAADDDPSGIATYSQAGAQFGFNMLWTMLFTYPLMTAIQLVSAHVGRVTGCGLARNRAQIMPKWIVLGLVGLLFIANTINIGANLAAMGAAAELAAGVPAAPCTVLFALLSLSLQLTMSYERYVRYLKADAGAVVIRGSAIRGGGRLGRCREGFVMPSFPLNSDSFTVIVAILGTTISPYLFFGQSSQEVEEINNDPSAEALKKAPQQAGREMRRMRLHTRRDNGFQPGCDRDHYEHGSHTPQ